LEWATVVKPFVQGRSFPDGIKVKADSVAGGNNSTRDDVVTVHKGTGNRLTDAVDVHRGSTDECDDEASSRSKKARNHENTEVPYV
jgi:hypothetical protein